jgi:hypothetical protein
VSEEELQRAVADERRRIVVFLRAWARGNDDAGGPEGISSAMLTAASLIEQGVLDEPEPPDAALSEANPDQPRR